MNSSVNKIQTSSDLAKKEGVSAVQVRKWCENGLVKGARKLGRAWSIPNPAEVIRRKPGRPWND